MQELKLITPPISIKLVTPLIAVSLLAHSAAASTTKEYKGFEVQKIKSTISKKKEPPTPEKPKLNKSPVELDTTKDNEHDLSQKVAALSQLLKIEKDPQKILKMHILRAFHLLKLAQFERIKVRGKTLSPREKQRLESARLSAEHVLRSAKTLKDKSVGLYLLGTIYIDLEQEESGLKHYAELVDMKIKTEYHAQTSMYLAESYFDKDDYQKALATYRAGYPNYNTEQKQTADFKMAWCHIGMSNWSAAELQFDKIIRNNKHKFFTESLHDLAFVYSQHRSETDIIRKADTLRASGNDPENIFLMDAYKLQRRDTVKKGSLLFQKVTAGEINRQSLALWLAEIDHQINNGSLESLVPVMQRFRRVIGNDLKIIAAAKSDFGEDFKNENETYISLLAEAVGGRSKEKIKDAISLKKELVRQLIFYNFAFPDSAQKEASYSLLLEACADLQEADCLKKVITKVNKDEALITLRKRAALEEIYLIENNLKASSDTEPSRLLKTKLEEYLKADGDNEKLKSRLAGLYIKDKEYDKAKNLFGEIYQKNKNIDSLLGLLVCLYNLKEYDQINSLKMPKELVKDARVQKILRESTLGAATAAGDDLVKMELNVQQYLTYSDSKTKSQQVFNAYLTAAYNAGDTSRLLMTLKKFSGDYVINENSIGIYKKLIRKLIKENQVDHIKKTIIEYEKHSRLEAALTDEIHLARIFVGQPKPLQRLVKMKGVNLKYYLPYYMIQNPDSVLSFLDEKPKLNPEEKKVLFATLQIKAQSLRPQLSPKLKKRLEGNSLPIEYASYPKSKIEKAYEQILSLKSRSPNSINSRKLKQLMEQTQNLRSSVMPTIKNKNFAYQLKVISMSIKAEKIMEHLILDSPPPATLTGEQIDQYRQGLVQLSKDFSDQSAEFQKVHEEIAKAQEKINSEIAKAADVDPQTIETEDFPGASVVRDLTARSQISPALVYLDICVSEKELNPINHEKWRRFIFASSANPAVRAGAQQLNKE